jgi:hypothetical protein|tara:strand:+ start:44 stop:280 length:237 start_codon:yes stop_codon:yes gene_type:complete
MAITIDDKEYDETSLDDAVKNSIVQVQSSTNTISKLKAEILNHQILIAHHSKNIKDNLPTDDDAEAPTEAADVGSPDE